MLPLQALVYPLPRGMLKTIAEKHAARLAGERTLAAAAHEADDTDATQDPLLRGALATPHPGSHSSSGKTRRLRLCYTSLGFGSHPHGQLMRGVFAYHNRSHVEVVIFALSAHDGSVERSDIEANADHTVETNPQR